MTLEVIRFSQDNNQTLSKFAVFDNWNCKTGEGFVLELPDMQNQVGISRINPGTYKCVKRNSPKYSDHFHVLGVEGRSYILIHHGNYNKDTRGCLLVGEYLADINKDGFKDVCSSKKTMKILNSLLPDEFILTITEDFNE